MADTGNLVLIGVPVDFFGSSTAVQSNSASTNLPTTNLQTADPKEVWRSTALTTGGGSSGIDITWDTYPLTPISASTDLIPNSLALINHNLTSDATFFVDQANTTVALTTGTGHHSSTMNWYHSTGNILGNDYSFGLISAAKDLVWISTANPLARDYYRLTVKDTGNTDGYIQAGKLIAGIRYEISALNFRYGWTFVEEDLSNVTETPSGSVFGDRRTRKRRSVNVSFAALTENEAFNELIHKLVRQKGITDGFYAIFQPNTTIQWHNQAFYCRLAASPALTNQANQGIRYGTALSFREIL